ncbi:hypothetical protein [Nonomuraea roseoviolacea]|uniref:Uncharacterized protein n=1 Tax=Nonomuraea roseoviolacea subsp. carminata TaxID=160689 RepID=A0ABT1K1P1_9ACTN|nr:hypothetical protein [Nonomuraea roseoviolacea]MCP2347903.1 hypothetical protein [Nonomuraea roseoviolacea subsp. carminata]
MDAVTLHTAARRYLMERYDELEDEYAALPDEGRSAFGYSYRREAWRIFPRYNVIAAILEHVERLDPDRLPEFADLVDALSEAAETAQSPFTQPASNRTEAKAMAEERRLFQSILQDWATRADLPVEPLPYRRVLTPAESAERQKQLRQRWGLVGRSWHPMLAEPTPPDVLVLMEASMWSEQALAQVRAALHDMSGGRVTELREYGADYLVDVEMFAPHYTGAEGVWSDDTLTWIAFASHEGTVAFGGRLAAALEAEWTELDRWRWQGL